MGRLMITSSVRDVSKLTKCHYQKYRMIPSLFKYHEHVYQSADMYGGELLDDQLMEDTVKTRNMADKKWGREEVVG